jgi:GNAT superfamily N-acetyltransferase
MGGVLTVRPLRADDRPAWDPLWQGYLTFYESALPEAVTDVTFRRFLDPAEPLHAVVAEIGGRLAGFAHYLLHRSTWAAEGYCYLEDLFVDFSARGHGVGRALIAAVEQAAREANASRLYWVTHRDNATAQALYEQVATRSPFIQYRKPLT